jgi:hypothetical protein
MLMSMEAPARTPTDVQTAAFILRAAFSPPRGGLGGRLVAVTRLPRGLRLGDAVGGGRDDRVLAARPVLPAVLGLPAQEPRPLHLGSDRGVGIRTLPRTVTLRFRVGLGIGRAQVHAYARPSSPLACWRIPRAIPACCGRPVPSPPKALRGFGDGEPIQLLVHVHVHSPVSAAHTITTDVWVPRGVQGNTGSDPRTHPRPRAWPNRRAERRPMPGADCGYPQNLVDKQSCKTGVGTSPRRRLNAPFVGRMPET